MVPLASQYLCHQQTFPYGKFLHTLNSYVFLILVLVFKSEWNHIYVQLFGKSILNYLEKNLLFEATYLLPSLLLQ